MPLTRVVLTLLVALALPNEGAVAAELNGAWVSNPDACEKILVVKDGKTAFSNDFYGSGFVIDEAFIRGKIATCKITSRKQSGKTVKLEATCATDIMLSSNKFSLVWIDDNKLVRKFPGAPEFDTAYQRCKR